MTRSPNPLGVALLTLVLIALVLAAMTLFGGLAVGAANAWILQGTFAEAWSAYWGRWLIGLGWSVLFLGATGRAAKSS